MKPRERFLKVFRHEIPDRVPSFVQHVMGEFVSKYEEEIFEYFEGELVYNSMLDGPLAMGFDACFMDLPGSTSSSSVEMYLEEYGKKINVCFNGRINLLDQPSTFYQQGAITTLDRWERIYETVKRVDNTEGIIKSQDFIESVQDKIFSVPGFAGIFSTTWMAMGFNVFAKEYRKKTALYKAMVKGYAETLKINVEGIINAVGGRPGILAVRDDVAFKGRLMISPKRWEEDFLPYYKEINSMIHDAGMVTMVHTDGDVTDLVPSLMKAGFDGLQGWEGGADPKIVKEKFPEFVVVGFGDVSEVLPFGTPEQIDDHVKSLMEVLKPGGNYVFGPSTVIVKEMPFDNVRIFMDAAKKYGNY